MKPKEEEVAVETPSRDILLQQLIDLQKKNQINPKALKTILLSNDENK